MKRLGDEYARVKRTDVDGVALVHTYLNGREDVRRCRELFQMTPTFEYAIKWVAVDYWCDTDLNAMKNLIEERIRGQIGENETWGLKIEKRRRQKYHTADIATYLAPAIDRWVNLDRPDKLVRLDVMGNRSAISELRPGDTFSVNVLNQRALMTDAVQHFAINTAGRDFAVGDIHGCFDPLRTALSRLLFDPEHDRMFATGDLVDRGPRSAAALEWLGQPWFHSCLGNHESMRLDTPDPGDLALWLLLNGGEWWLAINETARAQFLAAFARLPYALEVQTAHGRVGIVHADVPGRLTWPQFLQALTAGDPEAREAALWSRQRAEGWLTTPVADIERVVCGHTIMADGKPRVVGNVWLIDTGAFLHPPYGDLTILPLDALFTNSAQGTSAASPPLTQAE